MPTIKNPESDDQLLQALEAAKHKADITLPGNLAFSAATLTRLLGFLPNFRQQMQERGVALSWQATASGLAVKAKWKLRLFIRHFIRVFNFGIEREVYTAEQRPYYQLDVNQEGLPTLNTEQEIQMWGDRVVEGEATRVAAGFAPMSNPSAAEVAVVLGNYTTLQGDQSTKKDVYDHEQEDVAALRPEAHDIVNDIWDEVEFTFRKEVASSKRRKAREYGVVYEPNPGEAPSPEEFSVTGKTTESGSLAILSNVQIKVVETGVIVFSNSEGNFFVPTQPAGSYTIEASLANYFTQVFPGVMITDGVLTTLNIEMKKSMPTPP